MSIAIIGFAHDNFTDFNKNGCYLLIRLSAGVKALGTNWTDRHNPIKNQKGNTITRTAFL